MTAIVTVTMNPEIDVNTGTEQVAANRKLHCDPPAREPGGGGINVARALQRLGGTARAIFAAGGVTGARLTAMVADEGIEAQPIEIAAETREAVNVTERSSGSQFRFVMQGPPVRESEWNAVLESIASLDPAPKYLVASGTLPPGVPDDFYGRLSRLAAEHDIRLIIDTSGPPLRHAVGPGTFLIKPNLTEVRELTGSSGILSDFSLQGAASALVAAGRARAVVISMGAAGAIVATERGTRRISAPTVKVESRVGAGDSMVAGIVLELERGATTEEAVLFGIAAGTAAVMRPGTELCRREDAERLFEEIKKSVGR
jgi:6-phosphofructokinase 2